MGDRERAGQSLMEWLRMEAAIERAKRQSQALIETFPGTSQGRALPSSPIAREGGPSIPAVTIRRGGPAGEIIHLSGTSVSLASGGADLANDTIVEQYGFSATTAAGAEWTYPRTGLFKHDLEFDWDTFQGGGTVELLVNGVVVRTARDDGGGNGDKAQWYPSVRVSKGDTGKVRITQSSGSAQDASWDLVVSVQEPTGQKTSTRDRLLVDSKESAGSTSSMILQNGKPYTLVVTGNFRQTDNALGAGADDMFYPSPAEPTNQLANLDADTKYDGTSEHRDNLEFDLGSGFAHVEPDGGPFSSPESGHEYRFHVTGEGSTLSARITDVVFGDNNGQLEIEIHEGTL